MFTRVSYCLNHFALTVPERDFHITFWNVTFSSHCFLFYHTTLYVLIIHLSGSFSNKLTNVLSAICLLPELCTYDLPAFHELPDQDEASRKKRQTKMTWRRADTEPLPEVARLDLVNVSKLFDGAGTKRERSPFTAQSDEDLNIGPCTHFPPRLVRAKHSGLGRSDSMPEMVGRAPGENSEADASAAKSTTGVLVTGSYWLKNKVPRGAEWGLRRRCSLPNFPPCDADDLAVMAGIMLEDSASLDEMQHRSRVHILEIASRPTRIEVEELLQPGPGADAAGCDKTEHAVLGLSLDACGFPGEQPRHSVLCVSLPCTPSMDSTNEALISEFIDADGSPSAVESTLALLSRASA
jgi:hypothetical protein